jgi:hypothetical protein
MTGTSYATEPQSARATPPSVSHYKSRDRATADTHQQDTSGHDSSIPNTAYCTPSPQAPVFSTQPLPREAPRQDVPSVNVFESPGPTGTSASPRTTINAISIPKDHLRGTMLVLDSHICLQDSWRGSTWNPAPGAIVQDAHRIRRRLADQSVVMLTRETLPRSRQSSPPLFLWNLRHTRTSTRSVFYPCSRSLPIASQCLLSWLKLLWSGQPIA